MQSFYLMRFANTVVIVAFERLRFLAVVFRENTSVSLSKELRTQPVCQLGLSTLFPFRVKNMAWEIPEISFAFPRHQTFNTSNGLYRSVHYNSINFHGCLFHSSVTHQERHPTASCCLDFDNYVVSL